MLNLLPFQNGDAFDTYSSILDSKRDKDLVATLRAIDTEIQTQFDVFGNNASSNTLESIASLHTSEENKASLRRLYSSKNRIIQEVKSSIIGDGRARPVTDCQYCTINSVSSMDHIMPKSAFPEYSVHPHNLFPCCIECNGYKSEVWIRDLRRQFLNLYLDILPDTQYLFVELTNQNSLLTPRFYLDNREQIDSDQFALIERHYTNLHLFRRFAESSNTVITSLMSSLSSLPPSMTAENVTSFVEDANVKASQYFGPNYWRNVLQLSLSRDAVFLSSCGFTA